MQLNLIIISVVVACCLPTFTQGLDCQTGLKFSISAGGQNIESELASMSCPTGSDRCVSVSVDVNAPGVGDIPITVGQCAPANFCSGDVCAQVTSQLEQNPTFSSGQISNCQASCCSEDNCNSAMSVSYSVGMMAFLALTSILALLLN